MKKYHLLIMTLILAFSSIVITATPSSAIITTAINLEYQFTDDGYDPEGDSLPWLTATFYDDNIPDDSIILVMSTPGLIEEEYVSTWLFNVYPTTLFNLTFSFINPFYSSPNVAASAINLITGDPVTAGSVDVHGFNVQFEFPTSNTSDQFGASAFSAYEITSSGDNLTAGAFTLDSVTWGDTTDLYTVAHVQSIDITYDDNEGSGWITEDGGGGGGGGQVPEPSTLFLLGGGVLMLAARWRRKKK